MDVDVFTQGNQMNILNEINTRGNSSKRYADFYVRVV